MKKNWKFATMALIAGVSLFATSCSSDEDPVNNPGMEEKIPMFLTVTLPKM